MIRERDTAFPPWSWHVFLWFLVFAVYSPALTNEFVWDDHALIDGNAAVRGDRPIGALWREPVTHDGRAIPMWRPLPMTLHALAVRAGGTDPFVFHLLNAVLHAATASVFFGWLRRAALPAPACFTAAALFAVHPFLTSAVTYASGTADLVAALASLLALRAWGESLGDFERDRRGAAWQKKMLAGGVFWLAALFSKEWAAVLPLIALIAYGGRGGRRFWTAGLAMSVFLLGVVFCLRGEVLAGRPLLPGVKMEWTDRLACGVASFGFYQIGGLFPVNLRMDRFYHMADPEFWRWFAAGLALAAGWVWAGRSLAGFLRESGAWRGLAWFLVCWFLQSNVPLKLNAHFAEHWMYFGFLGLAWAGASAAAMAWPRLGAARRRALAVACVVLFLFWAGRSFVRQFDWQNDVVFFERNLQAGAHTSRSHLSMAFAYARAGAPERAIPHFRLVFEKDPANREAAWGLARCCFLTGRFEEAARLAGQLKESGASSRDLDRFLLDCREAAEKRKARADAPGAR